MTASKEHVTHDVLLPAGGDAYYLAPIVFGRRILPESEQRALHEGLIDAAKKMYDEAVLEVPDERHAADLGSVPTFPDGVWRERYGPAVGIWHRVPTNNVLDLVQIEPIIRLRKHIHDLHREVSRLAGEAVTESEFLESWIQFYKDGDRKVLHNHERYGHPFMENMWVGTYYIDDGAPDPSMKYAGVLSFRIRNENYLFRPEPGLLMLWPYDLLHEVHPFYGSRNRIVINFHIRGVD
jgi:Putative 2OG-Fe(II) oxygenase